MSKLCQVKVEYIQNEIIFFGLIVFTTLVNTYVLVKTKKCKVMQLLNTLLLTHHSNSSQISKFLKMKRTSEFFLSYPTALRCVILSYSSESNHTPKNNVPYIEDILWKKFSLPTLTGRIFEDLVAGLENTKNI